MHESQQALFARNVGKLVNYIFSQNYECTLGEAFRTKEQALLDAKNCTGIKNSLHCHRLAIDINLFEKGKYSSKSESYEKFGVYWESLNSRNRWGGRFKSRPDGNHFEYHPYEEKKEEHGSIIMPSRSAIGKSYNFEIGCVLAFFLVVMITLYRFTNQGE